MKPSESKYIPPHLQSQSATSEASSSQGNTGPRGNMGPHAAIHQLLLKPDEAATKDWIEDPATLEERKDISRRAVALLHAGEFSEARQLLRPAIQKYPACAHFRGQWLQSYQADARFASELRWTTKLYELSPGPPRFMFGQREINSVSRDVSTR